MKLLGQLFNMFVALLIFWVVILCGALVADAIGFTVDERILIISAVFIFMSVAGALFVIQVENDKLNK